MEKTLGKEYAAGIERIQFLQANAECVEKKGYMKAFSPEQMAGHKEKLANISIQIDEIEAEKKMAMDSFKERLKPLMESKKTILDNIKRKAEYVTEECVKLVDVEKRMTGYYNYDGDLIEERRATADEMQPNMFRQQMHAEKTGTDD